MRRRVYRNPKFRPMRKGCDSVVTTSQGCDGEMTAESVAEGLEEMVPFWQETLRLNDWDLHVGVFRQSAMEEAECLGVCMPDQGKKVALIQLCDPEDADGVVPAYDPEHILVHEMLHCHFLPFDEPDDTPKGIAQEQVIDQLARAFVSLRRRECGEDGEDGGPKFGF